MGRLIARVSQKLPRRSFLGTYLLGVTLGFLPCGFLYAALAASASSGSPATGASAMVAFGLGTVPALVVVGIAGQAAGRRFGRGVTLAAPFLLGLNAFTLLILALRHR